MLGIWSFLQLAIVLTLSGVGSWADKSKLLRIAKQLDHIMAENKKIIQLLAKEQGIDSAELEEKEYGTEYMDYDESVEYPDEEEERRPGRRGRPNRDESHYKRRDARGRHTLLKSGNSDMLISSNDDEADEHSAEDEMEHGADYYQEGESEDASVAYFEEFVDKLASKEKKIENKKARNLQKDDSYHKRKKGRGSSRAGTDSVEELKTLAVQEIGDDYLNYALPGDDYLNSQYGDYLSNSFPRLGISRFGSDYKSVSIPGLEEFDPQVEGNTIEFTIPSDPKKPEYNIDVMGLIRDHMPESA